MKWRLFRNMLLLMFLGVSFSTGVVAQDWNSSPSNVLNNQNTWQNNSSNFENSPNNVQNMPFYGNDRTIRDNYGNPSAYAVPKSNGGINFYDNQGNRSGYLPSSR